MIVQLIGIIAFVFLGLSNLDKDRKKIIIFQTLSCVFFSVHYYFLNALTASILNIIGIIRGITFYKKSENKKLNYSLLITYMLIYIVVGVYTFDSIFSLFPIFAYLFYTLASFNEKPLNIKLLNIPALVFWIIYDFIYKSFAGVLSDTTMIIVLVIGIITLNKNRN